MSANAHTAVMTDLEQRIQDGRQLSAPRPRINRIMEDRFYGRKPRVDIQRAVLFTPIPRCSAPRWPSST